MTARPVPPNRFAEPQLALFGPDGLNNHLVEREALRAGLDTQRLSPVAFTAHHPDAPGTFGYYALSSSRTSALAYRLCRNKQLTRGVLAGAGVAVPDGFEVGAGDSDRAAELAVGLGYPLVVKPTDGSFGAAVTTGVHGPGALRAAVELVAEAGHDRAVVEREVPGHDYRVFVLDGRAISAFRRTPGHVVGDGRSPVAELVLAKLEARQEVPSSRSFHVEQMRAELAAQGLDERSVPEQGRVVRLARGGDVVSGAETAEVLDEMHPSLLDLAVRAVAAVPGLPYAGVDLRVEDHTRPHDQQSAMVNELNATPTIAVHHFPYRGPSRPVAPELVRADAEGAGLPLRPPAGALTLAVTCHGRVQGVGYRRWLRRLATELGVAGWVRNGGATDVVEAVLSGPAGAVTALAARAITGPRAAVPRLVTTSHVDVAVDDGFEIRG